MKKRRMILTFILCLGIVFAVYYNVISTLKQVSVMRKEKKELSLKLNDLKEEGEALKVEASRLQDSEYVAKYAREKFLYSGKNEYIIRIE